MLQNDTLVLFSLNTCFKNVTQMQRKISIEEEECDSSSEENQKKMKMKDSFLGVSLKIVVFLCFLLCQVLL